MASTNETETFQHYQVLRRADGTLHELGRGAMGVTYKAFDTNLRSYVALKVINALHLDSETARARFLREARAAAALRHRNIASVYHLGNDEQSFFYAMEFVDGQTLEALVKEQGNALPPTDALQIALQVSRALGAAGKQGLVHRDIKPANIMVEREDDEEDGFVVKVIDFGLARSATGGEGSAHITIGGGFVGTPQYASPEQLEEKDLDIRSDIYSLGITLWYTLVGRPPFVGPLGSVFLQQLTKPPPWDQIKSQPDSVKALLARLLQKDPDKRPQSPTELRREIESCLRTLPPATARRSIAPASPKPVLPPADTTDTRSVAAKTGQPPPTVSASDAPVLPVVSAPPPAPAEPLGRPAVIATGTLLGGRYDLGDFIGQGNNGRVFRARDLARDGFTTAVKVLHADVLKSDVERTRLEETLTKLHRAPHPHLMEVASLQQGAGCRFLVQEWVNGFTLVDLLRNRGHLPVRETLYLLAQSASAADHASIHDLNRLELGLHQMLVHFPSVAAGSQGGRALLGKSVEDWPTDFSLKLDALGITREVGDSVTWGGDMTMMPATPSLGRDTQTSIRGLVESSQFFALGMLTYELLAGAPPAQTRNEDGRGIKYAALPSLNEEANDVLRRMLTPNPGFGSAVEFFDALCRASGVVIPLASSTTITPKPAAVHDSVAVETMLLDTPGAMQTLPEAHGGDTLISDDAVLDAPAAARPGGNLPSPPDREEIDAAEEALAEIERQEKERAEAERVEAERGEAERVESERREAARVEAERAEAERVESERREAARVEAERREAERIEVERVEAARHEAERQEAARIEAERREAARREAERIEAERRETERVEAERRETERVEAERRETERVEAERVEAARREAERTETERVEAERRETARLEAERIETERREAERIEAERIEAERLEAERLEAERIETERVEAACQEAERVEAARRETARLEAEKREAELREAKRIEAERAEAERLEAERIEAERQENARIEAERREAERAEAARVEAARLEMERVETARRETARREAERQEAARQEAARQEAARLEAERTAAARLEAERVAAARAEAERAKAERVAAELIALERVKRSALPPAVAPGQTEPLIFQARAESVPGSTTEPPPVDKRPKDKTGVPSPLPAPRKKSPSARKNAPEAPVLPVTPVQPVPLDRADISLDQAAPAQTPFVEADAPASEPIPVGTGSSLRPRPDSPTTRKREITPPSRKQLALGGIAAIAIVGGLCAVVLPRGSRAPEPVSHSAEVTVKPSAPATTAIAMPTAVNTSAEATPPVVNPPADEATPAPMVVSTPPPATPEPAASATPAAASTPPPPVAANVSTPPEPTPDIKTSHNREGRDPVATREQREAVARDQREAATRDQREAAKVAQQRELEKQQRVADDRRETEKHEAHDTIHKEKETKPDPTPRPVKTVAVKPPPPPPKKPAATPDPSANQNKGPGIGFLR